MKNIEKNTVIPFASKVTTVARMIRDSRRAIIRNVFALEKYELNEQVIRTASKVTRDGYPSVRIMYFDSEIQWLYSGAKNPVQEWCVLRADSEHKFFIIKEEEDHNVLYFCDEEGNYDADDSIVLYH